MTTLRRCHRCRMKRWIPPRYKTCGECRRYMRTYKLAYRFDLWKRRKCGDCKKKIKEKQFLYCRDCRLERAAAVAKLRMRRAHA